MAIMTDQEFEALIDKLIAQGHEEENIECKGPGSATDKTQPLLGQVIKAALAMSNTKGGGKIIVGFSDNPFEPVGLSPDEIASWDNFDQLATTFEAYSDPTIRFRREFHDYKGKTLLLLTIEEFDQFPLRASRTYEVSRTGKPPKVIVRQATHYVRSQGKPESVEAESWQIHELYQRRQNPTPVKSAPANLAIAAIEANQANQVPLVRRFLEWLNEQLEGLEPSYARVEAHEQDSDDLLVETLDQTTDLVVDFCKVAQSISDMNALEAATILYEGFGALIEHYNPIYTAQRQWPGIMPDLFKFVSYEMFVSFTALLIKNKRWQILNAILSTSIRVLNTPYGRPLEMPFSYVSTAAAILNDYGIKPFVQYHSLQALLIRQRHHKELQQQAKPLAKLVPFNEFLDADRFLFTWHHIKRIKDERLFKENWRGWSLYYYYPDAQAQYNLELFGPVPDTKLLLEAFGGGLNNSKEGLLFLLKEASDRVYQIYGFNLGNRRV